ncbi:MAG: O-antigen ligase family protein [Patescibacteria group bacterium]
MVLPGLITLVIIATFAGVVLQERAKQIFFHDPTVSIRITAYKDVWRRLVEPHVFLGVGYNAYQVAAKDAGLISDYHIHSRGGSDSSILTLLVTTGLIGTALFFIPLLLGFIRHYSLIYVWATVFLLVHSQFTNSLLYPHLLIPYILIVVLAL